VAIATDRNLTPAAGTGTRSGLGALAVLVDPDRHGVKSVTDTLPNHRVTLDDRPHLVYQGAMARRRKASTTSGFHGELPLAEVPKRRGPTVLASQAAAKRAIARRAKPASVPGHVRLILTLEVRRELAEKLSVQAIREQQNIEAIVIEELEAAARRWA